MRPLRAGILLECTCAWSLVNNPIIKEKLLQVSWEKLQAIIASDDFNRYFELILNQTTKGK